MILITETRNKLDLILITFVSNNMIYDQSIVKKYLYFILKWIIQY